MCRCRVDSKDWTETKTDDHRDDTEAVKSEKKVKKKMEQKRLAADAGVSGDTGEKRRRSRRLSVKEEMKDLDEFSASVKDSAGVVSEGVVSKGVVKELPVKEEMELNDLKPDNDEVVYLLAFLAVYSLMSMKAPRCTHDL